MPEVVNATGGVEIGGRTYYGMDAETHLKRAAKYDYGRERDIVKWLEKVLGKKLKSKDLHAVLKSGVILCELINAISPKMIPKINSKAIAMMEIDNITMYLKACWKLGVQSCYMFSTHDLYNGTGMCEVLNNLDALSALLARMKTYKGPILPDHEKDRSGASSSSGGGKPQAAKKWKTIETTKATHINELMNPEDNDFRSANLKLKQELEREIIDRQCIEQELEELKQQKGVISAAPATDNSTKKIRELEIEIEQLNKQLKAKATPTVDNSNKQSNKEFQNKYEAEKQSHAQTKNVLEKERKNIEKLKKELSSKPQASGASNTNSKLVNDLREENEMLQQLIETLRKNLDLAVQLYSDPVDSGAVQKGPSLAKHGTNYFIIDEENDEAKAIMNKVEECLNDIFSSNEVDFSVVVELNQFFKEDSGRRKFTMMLENLMQSVASPVLSDGSFELLLYFINTTLTEMDSSDSSDLITAKILMRASSVVKRSSDGHLLQEYISSYQVYHHIRFWEDLFWEEMFRVHKNKVTEEDHTLDYTVASKVLTDLTAIMLVWGSFKDEITRLVDLVLTQIKAPSDIISIFLNNMAEEGFWCVSRKKKVSQSGTWNPKKLKKSKMEPKKRTKTVAPKSSKPPKKSASEINFEAPKSSSKPTKTKASKATTKEASKVTTKEASKATTKESGRTAMEDRIAKFGG